VTRVPGGCAGGDNTTCSRHCIVVLPSHIYRQNTPSALPRSNELENPGSNWTASLSYPMIAEILHPDSRRLSSVPGCPADQWGATQG
jgi:hypothetical protein